MTAAGPKIMFVDDDQDFLKAQRAFFGSRGFHVLTAETAESALVTLASDRPDLIVLDLMMEHFDSGFTLAHQIRKDDRLRNVPLIMLSGVATATGQRFASEIEPLKQWSKLDAFVDKPVTGRQLLRLVEEKTSARREAVPQD